LTGVAPEALGVHQFNPYRKLARRGVPTIASELKKRGYRTVCVHPFAATFYDRDVVFPVLGFDEFIDISAFSEDEKSGPYIGDAAVADKVAAILGAANEPLFIFAITMENHGPLHQEKVADGDHARLYASAPPAGYDEFTIYLRHLQHTDAMLGRIHAALESGARPGWLCAFGDHVPILPGVYDANDFSDGRTDYVIVGTGAQIAGPKRRDIAPEDLAIALLRAAGLQEEKNR
jgi:phosphoglycerol transferase MdoB-like AlkP superfamily enzyme